MYFYFTYLNLCECFACVLVCAPCAFLVPVEAREALGLLELKSHYAGAGWELNTCPSQELVLLIAEPSFQPQYGVISSKTF